MDTYTFGNTDMKITRIGFGAWAIGGGDWEFGWGPQDDNQAIAAIRHAVEVGMNWIDTAAVYGLGHSEELVAKALKGMKDKPYVYTKCGLVWDDKGKIKRHLKAPSIRKECEASLRRLKTDVIDLYQIHWPVDNDIEEAWETMEKLRLEGKVRFIGVSNFDAGQIKRCLSIASVSSLQPPYSLINRDYETKTLPFCRKNNIGVIVYSPMGSGLLTGAMTRERISAMPDNDWRKNSDNFRDPGLTRNLATAELLSKIGEKYGVSAGEVAIAWTLKNTSVTAAIVGGRSASQVDGIKRASEIRLTKEDLKDLEGV
jgi:aryl-alcohol dehydrogenase-like predicted oxidoreductase